MAERPDTPLLPDLRLTCDARLPTNLRIRGMDSLAKPILGECTECSLVLCESINLAGCDGGSEYICIPCIANFLDDDSIPHDDHAGLDWTNPDAIAQKYNLQKNGINQTLECGCILTDMTAWPCKMTSNKYITLCTHHKIWCQPKVLMSDLERFASSCNGCDMAFPEHEMTICTPIDGKCNILCPRCYYPPSYWSA